MLTVAVQSGSEVQQMNAHMWAMIDRHHLGDLLVAQEHADRCIPMGTQANQAARLASIFDPIVATLAESSRNLWMLGDTKESRAHREDWDTCLQSMAEAIAFSSEHGLVQTMAWNHCVHGWAQAHSGKTEDGLAELQSAIEDSVRIMGQVACVSDRMDQHIAAPSCGLRTEEVRAVASRTSVIDILATDVSFVIAKCASRVSPMRGEPGTRCRIEAESSYVGERYGC